MRVASTATDAVHRHLTPAVTAVALGVLGLLATLATVLAGPPLDPTTVVALTALAGLGLAARALGRLAVAPAVRAPRPAARRHLPGIVLAVDQWALRAQPRSPRAP